MSAEQIIKALIPTISARPRCWFKLVEKLIEEGFTYNHGEAEWSNGEIRGRICVMGDKAWLRHRDSNLQSYHLIAR